MIATMPLERSGAATASARSGAPTPDAVPSPLAATSRLPILPQCHPDPAMITQMIREAAYFHALQRGFAPGHELDDWLAAEREVALHLCCP